VLPISNTILLLGLAERGFVLELSNTSKPESLEAKISTVLERSCSITSLKKIRDGALERSYM
jgi:hypothetical protein